MPACYRLKPYFRNVGAVCTLGFAVFGLTSVFVAYFNVDNSFARPRLAATCFGLFWGSFVLLGVWLLALHRQYRLYITGKSIRQRGVVSDRTVTLSTITELSWRRFPAGGSVRLKGTDGTLRIELGNFVKSERDEVISFLRNTLPHAIQFGWDEFCQQFLDSPRRKARARRAAWAIPLLFGVHAVAFLVAWLLRFGNQYLLLSLVNVALYAYFNRRYRNRSPVC